jgi:pyrroline-5-carboxylate reductase
MFRQANSKIDGSTVAIVGAGNMGEAAIKGLLLDKVLPADQILATHHRQEHCNYLEKEHGIMASTNNEDACECAVILLCVKPGVLQKVFQELKGRVRPETLVISIAAGVPIRAISDGLGCRNVVRCMPNTPAGIGKGVTGWTANGIGDHHRACAREIIMAFGEEVFFENEEDLDTVTGVSGTGTAYVFMLMEAMRAAAIREGLSAEDASKLVFETVEGAVLFAKASGKHLAELRDQVTSPGGTTAAAVYEMEKGGFRTIIADAIRAACERSRELGRKLIEKLDIKK